MFGIGGGELVLILIVVLLAVGPNQMPKMLKTVGKGIREVRRATRELQSTVGVDDLLRDEDFRDPLGLKKPIAPKPVAKPQPRPAITRPGDAFTEDDFAREQPRDGVDLDLAYSRTDSAIIADKIAAAKAEQTEQAGQAEQATASIGSEPKA